MNERKYPRLCTNKQEGWTQLEFRITDPQFVHTYTSGTETKDDKESFKSLDNLFQTKMEYALMQCTETEWISTTDMRTAEVARGPNYVEFCVDLQPKPEPRFPFLVETNNKRAWLHFRVYEYGFVYKYERAGEDFDAWKNCPYMEVFEKELRRALHKCKGHNKWMPHAHPQNSIAMYEAIEKSTKEYVQFSYFLKPYLEEWRRPVLQKDSLCKTAKLCMTIVDPSFRHAIEHVWKKQTLKEEEHKSLEQFPQFIRDALDWCEEDGNQWTPVYDLNCLEKHILQIEDGYVQCCVDLENSRK